MHKRMLAIRKWIDDQKLPDRIRWWDIPKMVTVILLVLPIKQNQRNTGQNIAGEVSRFDEETGRSERVTACNRLRQRPNQVGTVHTVCIIQCHVGRNQEQQCVKQIIGDHLKDHTRASHQRDPHIPAFGKSVIKEAGCTTEKRKIQQYQTSYTQRHAENTFPIHESADDHTNSTQRIKQ